MNAIIEMPIKNPVSINFGEYTDKGRVMIRRTISIILILLGIILFSACHETKREQADSASQSVSENPHVRDLGDAELLALVTEIELNQGGILANSNDQIKSRIINRTQNQNKLSVKVSYYSEPIESLTGNPEKEGICQLILLKEYVFDDDELVSINSEPLPFSHEDAQYQGISIGDSIKELIGVLGEAEEIISYTNNDPIPPEGAEYIEYRYRGCSYCTLYDPEMKNSDAQIGQIKITATYEEPGPRGIRIGDSLESVLQCFPQEYDYTSDYYQRIYGMWTAIGAGGMADENSVIVTADPLKVDPFMRIDFEDGKVNRITIGNRWI